MAGEIALQLYGESKFTEEKPAGALELQGWLELLWEDAPHLVVGGLKPTAACLTLSWAIRSSRSRCASGSA